MLVRALKTTHGSYGMLPRGKVTEVPDDEAKELIAAGYMIEELPVEKQVAMLQGVANDNEVQVDRPFVLARPTGGQTGVDAPQSSLPADQAQPTPISPPSEGEGQLESSPSTKDTDSARGQTHSTPATTTGGKRGRGRPRSRG